MKNQSAWAPSKFVFASSVLRSNPDRDAVSVASRLNVDLLATALQSAINQHAKGRLLDLGCGHAPLYEVYRRLVTETICVDWDNSVHKTSHLDFTANLNEPLQIAPEQFDTVILTDVLEHIESPQALLAEARRVLRPGGALIGSVPFMYRLHEEPHDHFRYTVHALKRMAADAGFTVQTLEAYGQGTDVLFDILGKLALSAHWRIGPVVASWMQQWGHYMRKTAFGRRLNQRHQAMPIGYLFVWRAA